MDLLRTDLTLAKKKKSQKQVFSIKWKSFSYHLSLSFNLGGWKLLLVIKNRALLEITHSKTRIKSCSLEKKSPAQHGVMMPHN